MRPTYRLGMSLALVAANDSGAELTGTTRLPPGRVIALIGLPPIPGASRSAYVRAWQVARIDGLTVTYRGFVEWVADDQTAASGADMGSDVSQAMSS